MAYLVGIGLAFALCARATLTGLDRDRAFYPGLKDAMTIVVCLTSFTATLIANPGVPVWWPPFCLSFDVVAGAYLAGLIARRKLIANP